MPARPDTLTHQYEASAPRWADKMRTLGYYDGYLGFLSQSSRQDITRSKVIDIGAGTGAMAEAFVAVNGAPQTVDLLDPSAKMLAVANAALAQRGVTPDLKIAPLDETTGGQFDEVLAAHVIEHFDEPLAALRHMRRLTVDGGRLWLVASKPHWCNLIIWLQWRHRTFRREELRSLLQDAGFEPETEYTFPSGPPSRTSFGIVARAI